MYEQLKKPIKDFLIGRNCKELRVEGWLYSSYDGCDDREIDMELIDKDGNEVEKGKNFWGDSGDDLADVISDAIFDTDSPSANDDDAYYNAINLTLNAELIGNELDLDVSRDNNFSDHDFEGNSIEEEIFIPKQFQGIFVNTKDSVEIGYYSGSGDSGDYDIQDSGIPLKDDFMKNVKKQYPNIEGSEEFEKMFVKFNDWLTAETQEFVERLGNEHGATNYNDEGCFGTVYAKFGERYLTMDTSVNMGFVNSDDKGTVREII
jgi:hypothetical protein